jgi:hypothetical protein
MSSITEDRRHDPGTVPSRGWKGVADALLDGLCGGLREHVPGAVGILVKSVAICLSMAAAHVLLGVSIAVLAASAGVKAIASPLGNAVRLLGEHERSK